MELQHVLDLGKELWWDPHKPWKKGKIDLKLGKDWNREKNEGKTYDFKILMKGSTRSFGVLVLGVVTRHVPFKPHKEIGSS
jgi:hypothetical protein